MPKELLKCRNSMLILKFILLEDYKYHTSNSLFRIKWVMYTLFCKAKYRLIAI